MTLGMNVHIPSTDLLGRVAAAGIREVRVDFFWDYPTKLLQRVVDDCRYLNLNILAISMPSDPEAFFKNNTSIAAEVRKAIRHQAKMFGRSVMYWSVWNEPNLKRFNPMLKYGRKWFVKFVLSPAYLELCSEIVNPSIVGPDLAHIQSAKWDLWLRDYLAAFQNTVNVVSHHVYPPGALRAVSEDAALPWEIPSVEEIVRPYRKPLWITETGVRSNEWGEDGQVEWLQYINEDPLGGRRNYWYHIMDDKRYPDRQYGIINGGGLPKKAYDWLVDNAAAS